MKRLIFTPKSAAASLALILIISSAGALIFGQPTKAARAVIRDQSLYLVDGRSSTQLVTTGAVAKIFADTGTTILFGVQTTSGLANSEDLGNIDLYLTTNQLSKPQRLTGPITSAVLDQSKHAAYYTTTSAELRRINLDGTNDIHVADFVLSPSLSPNGSQLIYQKLPNTWSTGQYFDQALGLTILDLSSNQERRLTTRWEDFAAIWSPTGDSIIYASINEQGIASLFTIPTKGGTRQQLTNLGQNHIQPDTVPIPSEPPTWSTTGHDLVFESDHEVWHLNFNPELNKINHAQLLAFGQAPQWGPDGKTISLLVGNTGHPTQDLAEIDLTGKLIH